MPSIQERPPREFMENLGQLGTWEKWHQLPPYERMAWWGNYGQEVNRWTTGQQSNLQRLFEQRLGEGFKGLEAAFDPTAQYELAASRLQPVFEQQSRGLSDRLAAMGFGKGSGMELRGLTNLGREQNIQLADLFKGISGESARGYQAGLANLLNIAGQGASAESQRLLDLYLGNLQAQTARRGQDPNALDWLTGIGGLLV